ncbi:hypothetical protein [Geodermatophilus sp. SYSU D00684]
MRSEPDPGGQRSPAGSGQPVRDRAVVRLAGVVNLGLALACAGYLVVESPDEVVFCSLLVVAFWLLVLGFRTLFHPADLTEPIHWINATYLVLFALHPLSKHLEGSVTEPYHGRFDIVPTYPSAILLGLLAMVLLNVAYQLVVGSGRRQGDGAGRTGAPAPGPVVLRRLRNAGWLLTGLGVLGLTVLVSLPANPVHGNSGSGRTAYAYQTPYLLIPATLVFLVLYAWGRARADLVTACLITAVYATHLMTVGARTPLLLALCAPALFAAVQWRIRVPRLGVLGIVVLAVFGFSALRDANSPTSSLGQSLAHSVTHPDEMLLDTFTADDTEMVDALALEMSIVPQVIAHEPGIMVVSTLGAPVPRLVWPGKPRTVDLVLNQVLFDRGVNEASVAYSMIGEAYFDSGALGVVTVAVAFGAFYGFAVRRGRERSASPFGTALLAVATALVPVVIRGILAYSLAIAAFATVPLFVLSVLVARWRRQEQAQGPLRTTPDLHPPRSRLTVTAEDARSSRGAGQRPWRRRGSASPPRRAAPPRRDVV